MSSILVLIVLCARLISAATPINLVYGPSVTASIQCYINNTLVTGNGCNYGGFPVSQGFDNNMATRWAVISTSLASPTQPFTILFDLGVYAFISSIVISWENNHATNYDIYVSADNINWVMGAALNLPDGDSANDPVHADSYPNLNLNGYRYVRLRIYDGYCCTHVHTHQASFWEIAFNGIAVTNFALNAPVTATGSTNISAVGTLTSSNDGSMSTRWATLGNAFLTTPLVLTYDLGVQVLLSHIVVNWENNHATLYNFKVSRDGSTYVNGPSYTNGADSTNINVKTDTFYNVGLTGRYVQLTMNDGYCCGGVHTNQCSIWEILINGIASAPVTVTGSSNPTTPIYGQTVSLLASFSPSTATGKVTYLEGTTTLGAVTVATNGVATLALTNPSLGVGVHTITVNYGGDVNYQAASITYTLTVTNAIWVGAHSLSGLGYAAVAGPYWGQRIQEIGGSPSQASCVSACSANSACKAALWRPSWECVLFAQTCGQQTYGSDGCTDWDTGAMYYQPSVQATFSVSPTAITYGQSVTLSSTVSALSPSSGIPTGNVWFQVGSTVVCNVVLVNGVASCTTNSLLVGGANALIARYTGDSNFVAIYSPVVTLNVAKATTSATITFSPNPATMGTSFTVTATLAPVNGVQYATGTVNFFYGTVGSGTSLGSSLLGGTGVASVNVPNGITGVGAGSLSIYVTYGGDNNFNSFTSTAGTQTISKAASHVVTTSSLNPAALGQSVTLTATLSAIASIYPTGTVTFLDGSATLGTGTINTAGVATFTTTSLLGGTHSITASYAGNVNFLSSTSSAVSQTISKGTTSLTITSSNAKPVFYQTFTLTATAAPTNGLYPSGQVSFLIPNRNLGTGTLSASGVASISVTNVSVGTYSVLALYGGDGNFNSYGLPAPGFSQAVVNAYWVGPNVNGPNWGQRIQEILGSPSQADCVNACTNNGGCQSALWRAGWECVLFAVTCGQDFSGQDGCASWAENAYYYQPLVTAAVTGSSSSISLGQSVTFTATISARSPAGGTPTGTVSFTGVPAGICQSRPLTNGQATCTTSALTGGTQWVNVRYNGDVNFVAYSGVNAFTVNVAQASAPAVTLTSSPTNPTYSSDITFTASVASFTPSGGPTFYPTGTVNFMEGSTVLGTGSITNTQNAVATWTTNTLSTGSHGVTAVYSGDGSFPTSQSNVFTQTVSQAAAPSITLTSSSNPASSADLLTLTATLGALNNNYPSGSVTFYDDTTILGTSSVNSGGVASLTLTTPFAVGTHPLSASYGGDVNFPTATAAFLPQTITVVLTNFALTATATIECSLGDGSRTSDSAACGVLTDGLDNDMSTRWALSSSLASVENPVVINLDLQQVVQLDSIIITWENNHCTNYLLQFSLDNSIWVDGPSLNEVGGDTNPNSYIPDTWSDFTSTDTYRYIRLSMYDGYCCDGVNTHQFSFWELAVNGLEVN